MSEKPPQAAPASKSSRPRLLAVGDAVAPTGFARVMSSLLRELQGDFDIHQLGINYHGDPHDEGWPIYPAHTAGDVYGVGRLRSLVESLRPHVVFMVYDLWLLATYMRALDGMSQAPKVVFYCPVDSAPADPESLVALSGGHHLVAYTETGRRILAEAAEIARLRHGPVELPTLQVIPHGIDTGRFFPLGEDDQRRRWKKRLAPDLELGAELGEGDFWVLNANRNQPRKRIDLTLEAFALFARDKPPNVRLYLHMGAKDMGWDVGALSRRLGIQDRLMLSTQGSSHPEASDEDLNFIYNACDVGLNTATGEGWGLVAFEHGATGAPQVMTAHPVARELWQGAAELVEPTLTLMNPGITTEAHLADPRHLVQALERLYQDTDHRRRLGRQARRRATRSEFTWPQVGRRFRHLLLHLAEDTRSYSDSDPSNLERSTPCPTRPPSAAICA